MIFGSFGIADLKFSSVIHFVTSFVDSSGNLIPIYDPATTRIVNGVNLVHVRSTAPLEANPLTLVPSYPDLPMEEVYARPFFAAAARTPAFSQGRLGRSVTGLSRFSMRS